MCIFEDFADSLKAGRQLVLMPVSRLIFDHPIRIEDFVLYPPASLDLSLLCPVPNQKLGLIDDTAEYTILDSREVLSSLTGFNVEILAENSCIAFSIDMEWKDFLVADHRTDIKLIKRLGQIAEPVMDLIRFDYCRLDLPDTLPGYMGSWNNSGPYQGALLYNPADHESYLIAGESSVSTIVRGLGLEICSSPSHRLSSAHDGEVGAIARHGLSLFTDTLYSASDTQKFIRAMTLLDYLAAPNDFLVWKKAKKEIACHLAGNPKGYQRLLKRFEELSSKHDSEGNQIGYRTLIVHQGKYLEDIIVIDRQMRDLFKELQSYIWPVLEHMLERSSMRWSEFLDFRKELKRQIGVIPDQNN